MSRNSKQNLRNRQSKPDKQNTMIFPMEDIGAKCIFQLEEVQKNFISAALDIPEEEIKSIKLLNTHLLRKYRMDKEGIVDVLLELNNRENILIEIQVRSQDCLDRRTLFYLTKKFSGVLFTGQKYRKLRRCVSISILDFDYLSTQKCHTKFLLRDEEGNIYTDLLEVHIIEIHKAAQEGDALKEWVEFFRCRKEDELETMQAKTKNRGILTAIEVLREMSLTKRIKEEYEYHQKVRRDQEAREDYVYDQGKAAGVSEGESRGEIRGILTTRQNVILELLEEQGNISPVLKDMIKKQENTDTLEMWLKLAAHCESIQEFEKRIGI